MAYDFDFFVVGGGSGGLAAARRAAAHGARVGLAEAQQLGGTCVNRGCVPKKLMVYAGRFGEQFEAAAGYGWTLGDRQFHWPDLLAAVQQEVSRLNGVYQTSLAKAGVQLFRHRARFVDEYSLAVGDRTITAAKILIAVGGRPVRPSDIPGIEHAITSDDIFQLPHQPRRPVIIGGGYIGSEFASICHGLGTDVVQLIREDKILSGFDEDLRSEIHRSMQQRGIQIISNIDRIAIAKTDTGVAVTVTTPAGDSEICGEVVSLAATGRSPNLDGLGLDRTDVALNDGAIAVDSHYRTTVPHILAVGDVTDRVPLTPVARREGHAVADTEFGQPASAIDYDTIPTAVFTTPELSTVGLTEAKARQQLGDDDVQVFRSRFQPLYYTPLQREGQALLKLVVQTSSDRILGAHMVGDHAAEIMQGVAIAVQMGATKANFDATVGIHPTTAEEFMTLG